MNNLSVHKEIEFQAKVIEFKCNSMEGDEKVKYKQELQAVLKETQYCLIGPYLIQRL